jgi:hypothetical protein
MSISDESMDSGNLLEIRITEICVPTLLAQVVHIQASGCERHLQLLIAKGQGGFACHGVMGIVAVGLQVRDAALGLRVTFSDTLPRMASHEPLLSCARTYYAS